MHASIHLTLVYTIICLTLVHTIIHLIFVNMIIPLIFSDTIIHLIIAYIIIHFIPVHIYLVQTRSSMTRDQHSRIFSIPLQMHNIKHYSFQNNDLGSVGTPIVVWRYRIYYHMSMSHLAIGIIWVWAIWQLVSFNQACCPVVYLSLLYYIAT